MAHFRALGSNSNSINAFIFLGLGLLVCKMGQRCPLSNLGEEPMRQWMWQEWSIYLIFTHPPTACRPVARSFPPPGAPLRAASWEWRSLCVRVPSDSVRCRLQYPFVSAETLFTAASKPKAQNQARRSFQLQRLTTGKPMTTRSDRRWRWRSSHVVVVCLAVKTAGFGV